MRERTYAHQKAAGIIPANARLAARPPGVPAWNTLSSDQQRVAARLMEAYAASLAYCDAQIQRVFNHLKASGDLESTLVIYVQGDNGSSAEGGPFGLIFEQTAVLGKEEDPTGQIKSIDMIGGPDSFPIIPAGWGWAMNTPFPWYKQVASNLVGIRNGLVISWPGHVDNRQVVRSQYTHVSDIFPTILQAVGMKAPEMVDGVDQISINGISLVYTFKDASASSERRTQIYEMMENIGIYKDGWMAGTTPKRYAWQFAMNAGLDDPENRNRNWELYDLSNDFSQTVDMAKTRPEKLKELQDMFWARAVETNILPIHDYRTGRVGLPTMNPGRKTFTYYGRVTRLPFAATASTTGRSYHIDADISVADDGASGVILAKGGKFGGHAFYLKKGHLVFHENAVGPFQYQAESEKAVLAGEHQVSMTFEADAPALGAGGVVTLMLDGMAAGEGKVERSFYGWGQNAEGFDIGEDTLTPVSPDYSVA